MLWKHPEITGGIRYKTFLASSVPAERAFSSHSPSGTDLVTADRFSLAGKTIEMTQFLEIRFIK